LDLVVFSREMDVWPMQHFCGFQFYYFFKVEFHTGASI